MQEINFLNRLGLRRAREHIQKNPQMWLAGLLFFIGVTVVSYQPALAGALVGAGASLLGAWITQLNARRSNAEDKARRELDARRYLAPKLKRTIDRILYIHGRAIPNFVCASNENDIKPNDLKEDFIPYRPVLYPNASQFLDLPGEEATALISFYDSLHTLEEFVGDWWEREGQLPVNIFNMILHHAHKCLSLALVCIHKFELEKLYPPEHESWGTLSSRIERSMLSEEESRKHHIGKFESKSATSMPR